MNIPTLVVMHGVPARRIGYAPLSADFIAVWGEAYFKCLKAWGIEESRLIVTGNPRYEGLPSRLNASFNPIAAKLIFP